jgi:hypothetical protein
VPPGFEAHDRYEDEEKTQIIELLKSKNKSPLQEFAEYLELYDGREPGGPLDVNHHIIREYTMNSVSATGSYEYILETDFKRELKKDRVLR